MATKKNTQAPKAEAETAEATTETPAPEVTEAPEVVEAPKATPSPLAGNVAAETASKGKHDLGEGTEIENF